MTLTDTSKYVLKVWLTTLSVGSFITFSILSTLTTFADQIQSLIDLIGVSLVVTLTATLLTLPVAVIFYTLAEIIVARKVTILLKKCLLIFIAAFLSFLFFVVVYQQGLSFLWTYSSTAVFFYSFTAVLIASVSVFKLSSTTTNRQK